MAVLTQAAAQVPHAAVARERMATGAAGRAYAASYWHAS
jgi:hypothetical protein